MRRPGLVLLTCFFIFGATMCALTILLLTFPGTPLDEVWRVNPDGHEAFLKMGGYAYMLMIVVGTACAAAAAGLWQRREWGRRLAIGILVINLIGDTAGAIFRHDYRTLIGLPIGGAMIAYLLRVGSFKDKGASVWNTD